MTERSDAPEVGRVPEVPAFVGLEHIGWMITLPLGGRDTDVFFDIDHKNAQEAFEDGHADVVYRLRRKAEGGRVEKPDQPPECAVCGKPATYEEHGWNLACSSTVAAAPPPRSCDMVCGGIWPCVLPLDHDGDHQGPGR